MAHLVGHLLVALAVTLAVGLAEGGGWPLFVMGAVLALSLWFMLFAGSFATSVTTGDPAARGRVSVRAYAVAAVVAVALGWVMSVVGDGPSWWAVGFIMAGAVLPAATAGLRSSGDGA